MIGVTEQESAPILKSILLIIQEKTTLESVVNVVNMALLIIIRKQVAQYVMAEKRLQNMNKLVVVSKLNIIYGANIRPFLVPCSMFLS